MSNKPVKPKPQYYSIIFPPLQEIAKDCGYNLILHGSMNRDLDLVAIPWIDEPCSHIELLYKFDDYLKGWHLDDLDQYMPGILPGGRSSYVINIYRGPKFSNEDPQYYLDISFTPLITNDKIEFIKQEMDKLTDDERSEVIGNYCKYCGSTNSGCQCWNDE